ncbi:MAG: quinone-dependent dihydroorotate dehydrogenase [Rhodobacteraceae bacterium]|nr:quinone-dependent dihydroorotate dehydrogenase [Paracoccaceae bacterium]
MPRFVERIGLAALRVLSPETAHGMALLTLNMGLGPSPGPYTTPLLRTRLAGLDLPNPVGLAAGFDKNATAFSPLTKAGFGFVEFGTATPHPQTGNPEPRIFRLTKEQAIINRFGCENDGMRVIAKRLKRRPREVKIGLNIGPNKDSADKTADYVSVLSHCAPHIDFATLNVSSPNTEHLRELQGKAALTELLGRVMDARAALDRPVPVFLKIAPDLDQYALDGICAVSLSAGIDAIVATNTTVSRNGVHSKEAGGLSGAPLFKRSTRILAQLSLRLDGRIPLIGVGGISCADNAYAKIQAGASAVQLYTALEFHGLSLVGKIAEGVELRLRRDGFANVAAAVGSARNDWL